MAEPSFDRRAFTARLTTARLGRAVIALAETGSTNDAAWEAVATAAAPGAPDGLVVVADAQSKGRGRMGRLWHTAPGLSLALSLALRGRSCLGEATPLAAGAALRRALGRLGLDAELKWPNDVTARGRKLAGILTESRMTADGARWVVLGVGVNVTHRRADFPPELAECATSLALEGVHATREEVAAELFNALEPILGGMEARPEVVADLAWREMRAMWAKRVRVETPTGVVEGTVLGLDPSGALRLADGSGRAITVLAGDVEILEPAALAAARPRAAATMPAPPAARAGAGSGERTAAPVLRAARPDAGCNGASGDRSRSALR